MARITLHASDISCEHCARTITRELGQVAGIRVIEVDVPTKRMVLEYHSVADLERARRVLDDIGYSATEVTADSE